MSTSQNSGEPKMQTPQNPSTAAKIIISAFFALSVFACGFIALANEFLTKMWCGPGALCTLVFWITFPIAAPFAAPFGMLGGLVAYRIGKRFSTRWNHNLNWWMIGGAIGGMVCAALLAYSWTFFIHR